MCAMAHSCVTRLWPIVLHPCHLEYRSHHERSRLSPWRFVCWFILTVALTGIEHCRSIGRAVPAPLQLSELAFPEPSYHNARPGLSTTPIARRRLAKST